MVLVVEGGWLGMEWKKMCSKPQDQSESDLNLTNIVKNMMFIGVFRELILYDYLQQCEAIQKVRNINGVGKSFPISLLSEDG